MSQSETSTLNHYGQMALEHWQRNRAEDLAAIEDQQTFFRELGEQVAEMVANGTERLIASQPPATGFADRTQQELTARQTVEDETLRQMVFTAPTSDTSP